MSLGAGEAESAEEWGSPLWALGTRANGAKRQRINPISPGDGASHNGAWIKALS